MKLEISINKAILHVLDTNASIPVLSDMILNMSQGVREYLEKHIERSLKDPEVKRTVFRKGSPFRETVLDYLNHPDEMIRVSTDIGRLFFNYMLDNIEIPSADLVCVDFNVEHETYLGILKFNYKQGYIHFVNTDNGLTNDILVQPCVLPTESQKLDEFILINLATEEVLIKEKQFTINNEKDYYISSQLIFCEPAISEKAAFDILDKAAKEVILKEYSGDYQKLNAVKTVLAEDYEAEKEIDIDNFARTVFAGDETIQEQFRESLETKGLSEKKIPVTTNLEKKIYGKQKFITDTGIEISIPMDQLNRNDIIEFKNNPNGTISVEIKNIGLLNQK
jgi:hypothetical protein